MKNILSITLLLPFLVACNPAGPADKTAELTQKLVALDKTMGGAAVTDKNAANEFIKTSEALATIVEKTNPDQYVDLLLKAAGLAKTVETPLKAVELYKKVAEGMPQHPKAPTALFMMGFVYENDLNDLEKAKITYETFLKQYPNDPDFADDAQTSLKMLGKSPEEIIKEFEQKPQE